MAIVKIGPPLAGIRGTIGGTTYSANGSGPYAKQWASPSNPRTANQTNERGFLAQMPTLWRALTAPQKAAWDTFAALPAQDLLNSLGETYSASGYNWFCKCNIRLLRVGRTTIKPVPTQTRPAAPTIDGFRVTPAGSESDLCVGGVASADSIFGVGFEAAKAFDDDINTLWGSANAVPPHWLRYDLTAPALVLKYTLTARTIPIGQEPKDWQFQGWTGAAWDILQTVTNEPAWAASEKRTFYLEDHTTTYSDYRWLVTANIAVNLTALAEAELFLGAEGSSVIVYPEDDFDNAPDYDLILHVAPGMSTGKQVQYPGFLEILASQSPGRTYLETQSELEATFGTILAYRSWFARLHRQTQEGIRSAPETDRTETSF